MSEGTWVRIPARQGSFKIGQRFLQALQYRRGHAKDADVRQWQRIARLSQACQNLIQFEVHFPPRSKQEYLPSIKSFTVDADAKDLTVDVTGVRVYATKDSGTDIASDLSPESVTRIAEWRCDAVVMFTENPCRLKADVEANVLQAGNSDLRGASDFGEILHIQEYANGDARSTLQRIVRLEAKPILAEVPRHWNVYFRDLGATPLTRSTKPTADQMELALWLIPPGSAPKVPPTQIIDGPSNPIVYPRDPSMDLSALKKSADDLKRPLLVGATYAGSKQQQQTAFDQDFAMVTHLPTTLTPEDENQIKTAHANMLNYVQANPTSAHWQTMARAEQVLSPRRLVSASTAVDWYNGRLQMTTADKLPEMRAYAEAAGEQSREVEFEAQLFASATAEQQKRILQYRASNIRNAADIASLATITKDPATPKNVTEGMRKLRKTVWPAQLTKLLRESEQAVLGVPAAQDPVAKAAASANLDKALAAKQAAVQQAVATEQAYRAFLKKMYEAQNQGMSLNDGRQWTNESQQAENALVNGQAIVSPSVVPSGGGLAPSTLTGLITQPTFGAPTAADVTLPALPEPSGTVSKTYEASLEIEKDLKEKQDRKRDELVEEAAKLFKIADETKSKITEIVTKMRELGITHQLKNWQESVDGAAKCYQSSLRIAIQFRQTLKKDEDGDPTKETTLPMAELEAILETFKSNNQCLAAYWGVFQVFEKESDQLFQTEQQKDARKELVRMKTIVAKAETAVAEAKAYVASLGARGLEEYDEKGEILKMMDNTLQGLRLQYESAAAQSIDKDSATRQANEMQKELEALVAQRLLFTAEKEKDMERAVIYQALQGSKVNVEKARLEAKRSADVAKEYYMRAQQAENAQKTLIERATLLTAPMGTVTIHRSALDEKATTLVENRRVVLKALLEDLLSSVQDNNAQGNLPALLQKLREAEAAGEQYVELKDMFREAESLRREARKILAAQSIAEQPLDAEHDYREPSEDYDDHIDALMVASENLRDAIDNGEVDRLPALLFELRVQEQNVSRDAIDEDFARNLRGLRAAAQDMMADYAAERTPPPSSSRRRRGSTKKR